MNREYRIRTYDPLVPNQVLYQAELIPEYAPNRSRTCNRLIRSQVLYPIELWVQILFNCIENAEGRGRTGTVITDRRILSPVRLPIPPPRQGPLLAKRKTGFEPATPTLARWCSTTELLPQMLFIFNAG